MTVAYNNNQWLIDNPIFTWAGLTLANPDGSGAYYTGSGDRTVQVSGIFGAGGAVAIEGTLDSVNWFPLKDTGGITISFTTAGLKSVMENVVAIRPRITSGDGTTLITALLVVRRAIPM